MNKLYIMNFTGLADSVDDVSAVAASSLIPIAPKLTELVLGSVPQVSIHKHTYIRALFHILNIITRKRIIFEY